MAQLCSLCQDSGNTFKQQRRGNNFQKCLILLNIDCPCCHWIHALNVVGRFMHQKPHAGRKYQRTVNTALKYSLKEYCLFR